MCLVSYWSSFIRPSCHNIKYFWWCKVKEKWREHANELLIICKNPIQQTINYNKKKQTDKFTFFSIFLKGKPKIMSCSYATEFLISLRWLTNAEERNFHLQPAEELFSFPNRLSKWRAALMHDDFAWMGCISCSVLHQTFPVESLRSSAYSSSLWNESFYCVNYRPAVRSARDLSMSSQFLVGW